MFAGNFAPAGWHFCDGALLPISENDALFNLIGTTYGGDGQSTFALPDLRGRLPVHLGNGFTLAQNGGAETVTLTTAQIPSHTHPFVASPAVVSGTTPVNNILGQSASFQMYIQQAPTVALGANASLADGGSQPHDNMQPYLCVSFIISLFGIYPSAT
jgi:microcystin-dependent protein